jgi:hypothetical protein
VHGIREMGRYGVGRFGEASGSELVRESRGPRGPRACRKDSCLIRHNEPNLHTIRSVLRSANCYMGVSGGQLFWSPR